jgi:hypothetical protein
MLEKHLVEICQIKRLHAEEGKKSDLSKAIILPKKLQLMVTAGMQVENIIV